MPKVCAFSICSNNYIPYINVLFSSLRRFHPDFDLFLCLVDDKLGVYGDYNIIEARHLNIPDFDSFSFQYSMLELNTAVKPFMFIKLFRELAYDQIVYLDPDIELFSPISTVMDTLNKGASFVLTPHLCQPAEGESAPDDVGIMRAGAYNLGFLACSNHIETEPILRWWARRLRFQCVSQQERGLFVDQKFMDLVPGFADHVRVLRDPTLNVAYWNLQQRSLSRSGDTWTVEGEPLKFFHFSGIDPKNPSILSKYTHHFRGDRISPCLQELMNQYCRKVCELAEDAAPGGTYAYGKFASGTPIHSFVREMFREHHVPWVGNPFDNYEAFLHAPAFGTSRDSAAFVVTNFMRYCWNRFPHVHNHFDLGKADHVRSFVHWYLDHAHSEWNLDLRMIEPVAARAGRLPVDASRHLRLKEPPDVTVVGYLKTASGVGEAGRQMLRTLSTTRLRVQGHDVSLNVAALRNDSSCDELLAAELSGRVQIFNINADQLPAVLNHVRLETRREGYRIAIPFWELAEFPEAGLKAFDGIDEIWASTRFIQTALVRRIRKPVIHMPMNLTFEPPGKLGRAYFSLPEDKLLFFSSFDFLFFQERKNPRGLLKAFRRAFGDGRRQVALVIKGMNGDRVPQESAALREELADEAHVIFIDKTMTRAQTLALIDACDCVVSLHRSEGLGLLIAEAMGLMKPVISTDYSATTELITPATGFPVDYRLIPVEEGQYPFANGVWADPDIAHAAWLMRYVYDNPAAARPKIARAKCHIEENYGARRTTQLYLGRLREIGLVERAQIDPDSSDQAHPVPNA